MLGLERWRPASPPPPTEDFKALFNLATGAIPHPTDLFFAGSTDGTLNLPVIAYRPAVDPRRTEHTRRLVDDGAR